MFGSTYLINVNVKDYNTTITEMKVYLPCLAIMPSLLLGIPKTTTTQTTVFTRKNYPLRGIPSKVIKKEIMPFFLPIYGPAHLLITALFFDQFFYIDY